MKQAILTYDASHLSNTDKVRFYYALKGRDTSSGIIKKYDIEYLGKGVLLVPSKNISLIKDFFSYWNIPIKLRYAEVYS